MKKIKPLQAPCRVIRSPAHCLRTARSRWGVDDPTITKASGGDGSDIGAFEYGAIVPRLYLPLILG